MKIRLLDRVLLTLYTIAIIAMCVIACLIAWQVVPMDTIQIMLSALRDYWLNAVIVSAVALLFFIVSLKLLFSGVKKQAPESALIKVTENGAVRIALSAIDALVQKHARHTKQVRDVKSQVVAARDGGVRILLRLAVMPDSIIPELTEELQRTTKEEIESHTGIQVSEIRIYVESTVISNKEAYARVD